MTVPMTNPPLTNAKTFAVPSQLSQLRNETPSGEELRHRLAGRELLAKIIAEFAYEGLLDPIVIEPDEGWYRLAAFEPAVPGQPCGPDHPRIASLPVSA